MLNKIGRYLNVLNALNIPLFFLDLDRVGIDNRYSCYLGEEL